MKYKVILFGITSMVVLIQNGYCGSVETSICLHNATDKVHYIRVADIENYDWGSRHRPDINMSHFRIQPNQTICKREDINSWSKDPNFTLRVDDVPQRMRYSAADKNTIDAWNVQQIWEDRLGNKNPAVVRGYSQSPFGEGWEQGFNDCHFLPNVPPNLKNCWGFWIGPFLGY